MLARYNVGTRPIHKQIAKIFVIVATPAEHCGEKNTFLVFGVQVLGGEKLLEQCQ